ncbi:response regulator [Asticcacaulis biprosthecium C19]|uniref:Response regulator n=1 Tax=Asticcacaulis biprosthecium C19 TaxID=715226 RepID=F4QNI8_9CAUL|nr:response regulator [Asticcacaulis biprosthecium]EGF90896.1 response regulator [Asticcacaulis biprosthecium C19]
MSNLLIREGRAAEILLVEDNRGDVLLASRAFKEAQIENNLTVASTAEEALAILRASLEEGVRLPDIILLDLNLPKMSGNDLLGIVKGDEALRHIPVIIMSSSVAEIDVSRSYDRHANAYIAKPVDLEKFRQVISSIEQFFFMLAILPAEKS